MKRYFNNKGFTDFNNRDLGELAFGGLSLPIEELEKLQASSLYSNFFRIETKDNQFDNLVADDQIIVFNEMKAKKILFAATSSNGDFYTIIKFLNRKKVVEKINFEIPEFQSDNDNTKVFIEFSKLYSQDNVLNQIKPKIWFFEFNINTVIDSILFDDNPFVHFFAITLVEEK